MYFGFLPLHPLPVRRTQQNNHDLRLVQWYKYKHARTHICICNVHSDPKQIAMSSKQERKEKSRLRYHVQMEYLKATGQYETFRYDRCVKRREKYKNLPAEKLEMIRQKNRLYNKQWIAKRKKEGT